LQLDTSEARSAPPRKERGIPPVFARGAYSGFSTATRRESWVREWMPSLA
jgi:hypothetical protein